MGVLADSDLTADPAFDHELLDVIIAFDDGAGVEVHEAFLHDRCAWQQMCTEPYAIAGGDAHTFGDHVVEQVREAVVVEDRHPHPLAHQLHPLGVEPLVEEGTNVGPDHLRHQAEGAFEVQAVRLDLAGAEQVEAQVDVRNGHGWVVYILDEDCDWHLAPAVQRLVFGAGLEVQLLIDGLDVGVLLAVV